jgi:hypothetical protein
MALMARAAQESRRAAPADSDLQARGAGVAARLAHPHQLRVGRQNVVACISLSTSSTVRPFFGFDTDRSHGSLLRFYADFAAPVVIDRYEEVDRIVEAATEQPERRIIGDLAAHTHQFLAQWIEDSGLLDIRDKLALSPTGT